VDADLESRQGLVCLFWSHPHPDPASAEKIVESGGNQYIYQKPVTDSGSIGAKYSFI
jgi:hypothetical protein